MEIEYILFILVLFFLYICIIHTYVICCPLVYIYTARAAIRSTPKKKKTNNFVTRDNTMCYDREVISKNFASKIPFSKCHLDCVIDLQITTYKPSYDSCTIKAKIRGQRQWTRYIWEHPPPPHIHGFLPIVEHGCMLQ